MPKLGLISDSHGLARLTGVGASLLVKHGATMLVHLGDICSLAVLDAMLIPGADGQTLPVHITWGNNDEIDAPGGWASYAQSLGIHVHYPSGMLFKDTATPVGFTHGHLSNELKYLVARKCPYVLHGHSHVARDIISGSSRVINPGALYRVSVPSVALLDTDTGECRFFELSRE
jgi:uncharacterized protein